MISASSATRNTTPFCPVSNPSSEESLQKLEKEITYLAGFINAATCRFLLLVAEFDRRDGWHGAGMISCAHWLNWRCGIGLAAAREKVRVARALGGLELIRSSFEKGELSYSKVRAMTRVATPENESVLMQVALYGTAHHVETMVRKYRQACELQVLDRAKAQYEARGLSCRYEEDDSIVIRVKLPPEQGEVVLKALQVVANRLWKEEHVSAVTSSSETGDVSAVTPDSVSTQKSTPGQRRADALVILAEESLARDSLNGEASCCNRSDRYLVTVHVGEETLSSGREGRCELEDGPSLAVETARRLACDAGIVRILEDGDGNIRIGKNATVGPNAEIGDNVKLRKGSTVADGATVGSNTNIGKNAVVGPNAVIGDNVNLKKGATVGDGSVLRKNVFIDAGVTLARGVYVGPGAVIDDGTVVGRNSVICDDATIGANASLARNVFVEIEGNVPPGDRVSKNVTIPGLGACVPP